MSDAKDNRFYRERPCTTAANLYTAMDIVEAYNDGYNTCWKDLQDGTIQKINDDIRAENKRLREALKFYATKENYYEEIKDHIFRTTPIREDGGEMAKQALQGDI